MTPANAPTELYASALQTRTLYLRGQDGRRRHLPVERWLGPLGAADARALERARGPVLDVGCGPGRHVLALARRGVLALGVDIAPAAVRHARDRGAAAVLGSIFDPVPDAGRWRTALLLDGNIGIGGRPTVLLSRVRDLLLPGGPILCELGPPGSATRSELVALENPAGERSRRFAWAEVSVADVADVARRSGLAVHATWRDDRRWFAELRAAAA